MGNERLRLHESLTAKTGANHSADRLATESERTADNLTLHYRAGRSGLDCLRDTQTEHYRHEQQHRFQGSPAFLG